MSNGGQRGLLFKIVVLWFAILILGSFAASLQSRLDAVAIRAMPEAPRQGEPILVTFFLNNPSHTEADTHYGLYANGEIVMSGTASLAPNAGRQFQYVYSNPLKTGEQVTFVAKTQSDSGNSITSLSVPAYHPALLSSFVSFATFATSVVSSSSAKTSSINSMAYYDGSFVTHNALNVGLIISIALIILLIYMELSEPLAGKRQSAVGNLRTRFGRLSSVLFIIFVGMVLTQIALIIGGVR
ncbi:MAG: hypothetical protein O8C65_10745 [Candidatus Methanoperedens sp.]|nr:hypothetical protein [Candidatus Methanoperedens sp.]